MTDATHTSAVDADREIVLERVFDAPRALVFQAWTDARHLPHWFGPKGFTTTTHAIDLRAGGAWHFTMHGPDGTDFPNFMRFVAIVAEERIDYEQGDSPDGPSHFRGSVTFADEDGRTRMHLRMVFPTAEACTAVKGFGAVEFGYQTLDKLGERLKAMGFHFSRTCDAPRTLVYQAWSEAERLAKWWGPKGFDLEVKKLDFQPGGIFHYRMHNAAGHEMWGKFVYVETTAPQRIVYISSFSDPAGNTTSAPFKLDFPLEVYNIVTFSERDGKTTVELAAGPLNATLAQRAVYEDMFASMNQGFSATFDQMEAYLAQA